jgi:predicted protein tyrosine phosphatase
MLKVLFVCSQNRLRSVTAERIFRDHPHLEVRSAGTDRNAQVVVSADLVAWADLVFVMEKRHHNVLRRRFKPLWDRRRLFCLHIPDNFDLMDPELVRLLEEMVRPILDRALSGPPETPTP